MHRLFTALLLGATLATPVLAQDRDQGRDGTRPPRADRTRDPQGRPVPDRGPDRTLPGDPRDAVGDRPIRAEPPGQFDTVDRVGQRPDRGDRDGWRQDGRYDGPGGDRQYPDDRYDRDGRRGDARDDRFSRGDRYDRADRDDRDTRYDGRPDGNYGAGNYGPGGYARGDDRGRGAGGAGWNRDWRRDQRYDWQSYRRGNDRAFRMPRYYGPQGIGAGYRRWAPGYRIQPSYYGRNYWIARPDLYRLPPAYGGYRWVRYYNDVALVDIRSGLIVDILYAFFL